MGETAALMGDRVTGSCPLHLVPSPAGGAPAPAPPMSFSAPLTTGCCPSVLVGDKPAAVLGAQGFNTPGHVGLHPADPFLAPPTQIAVVTAASPSVRFGGIPAVRSGDSATCCGQPVGTVTGTASSVLIG